MGRTDLHGVARALWIAALAWAILFSVLAGLFASGYAMDDPGGLAGLGLVAAILVPMALGSLLAWRRPEPAFRILVVVAVVGVAAGVWNAIDPLSLVEFENRYGPVSAIASFITMVPFALAWRARPWPSTLLLLVVALAGLVPEWVRTPVHLGSSAAAALPMLLEVVLLALAAVAARRP